MFTSEQKAIADISDSLQRHSFALHAFASLLTVSNFEGLAEDDAPDTYFNSNIEKQDLRLGFGILLELYLEHQQKILNEYMDSSYKGNSWFTNKARNIISLEESGAFSSNELAINELMGAIAILGVVLNGKVSNDNDIHEAEELKATCLQKIEELKGS